MLKVGLPILEYLALKPPFGFLISRPFFKKPPFGVGTTV
jgi:hypothetical protein